MPPVASRPFLQMASLPSFVQLMASLGLSDPKPSPDSLRTDSNSRSAPSRSVSSPALRESAARQYSPRYSPYSPSVSCHNRKDSLSSVSSHSDPESSSKDHIARRSAPLRPSRYRHRVNRSDSSSDVAGDTPISTYVRRSMGFESQARIKTPASSPRSFNFDSGYESGASLPQTPFSIPTLPVLLINSDIESPSSDCEGQMAKDQDYYRFILLQRKGTRISTARAARREQLARRCALPS